TSISNFISRARISTCATVNHSLLSMFRLSAHPRPKVQTESVPVVLVLADTYRPRLDRSDADDVRAVIERDARKPLQGVVDRLCPDFGRPRVDAAPHEHLNRAGVERMPHA